jgi:hypothetical protein
LGVEKQPTKAPFFLFGGLVSTYLKKERPMIYKIACKFIGPAPVRPAL